MCAYTRRYTPETSIVLLLCQLRDAERLSWLAPFYRVQIFYIFLCVAKFGKSFWYNVVKYFSIFIPFVYITCFPITGQLGIRFILFVVNYFWFYKNGRAWYRTRTGHMGYDYIRWTICCRRLFSLYKICARTNWNWLPIIFGSVLICVFVNKFVFMSLVSYFSNTDNLNFIFRCDTRCARTKWRCEQRWIYSENENTGLDILIMFELFCLGPHSSNILRITNRDGRRIGRTVGKGRETIRIKGDGTRSGRMWNGEAFCA